MEMVKIKNWCRVSALLAATAFGLSSQAWAKEVPTNMAKLQAMDKITGRVSVIEVPVNAETKFGSFSIVVRACKTRPPEETPDNYAFVDVVDEQLDGKVVNIFKGWMISSSPALNAIEHPIYDVWLLQCFNGDVSKAKILSDEELRARDEIIMEQDLNPSENGEAPQNDGEPENLISFETSTSETSAQPSAAENAAQTQPVSENNPQTDNALETVPTKAEVLPQEQEVVLPEAAQNAGETVFETEAAYNIEGEPQELLPVQSNNPQPKVQEASSESVPAMGIDSANVELQEGAFENIQVLEPEAGGVGLPTDATIQNSSAVETADFGTPEEFVPEDEGEQTIEFDNGQYQQLPELNM